AHHGFSVLPREPGKADPRLNVVPVRLSEELRIVEKVSCPIGEGEIRTNLPDVLAIDVITMRPIVEAGFAEALLIDNRQIQIERLKRVDHGIKGICQTIPIRVRAK